MSKFILDLILGFSLILALTLPPLVWADPIDLVQAPCGILEGFAGEVQILDSTRTHLVDASPRAALPCGSWVSVNQGWAQVRHLNGPHVHLSAQTFAQLPNFKKDPHFKGDHLLLYRGQAYIQAGDGEEEFRAITASGRARVKRGKVILLFSPNKNNTQLIALENLATLENRFEPSRKVEVRAGESTEINFKILRVIPTLPKAIAVASLKPKLAQLRVSENEQFDAVRAAIRRQGRRMAAQLIGEEPPDTESQPPSKMASRKLASQNSSHSYLRHEPDPIDPMLHKHWVNKMVGGEQIGERILFPDVYYGKMQRVHVEVEDPSKKLRLKQQAQEKEEKNRLIEELSRIRVE